MSEVIQNTIYVMTQGSYLYKEGETIAVSVEHITQAKIPMHLIQGVVGFGEVSMSPFLMHALAERSIAVTFLSMTGRLLCRVDAPSSGNVLLRREQFRKADLDLYINDVSRAVVAGKIQNSRTFVLRAAREMENPEIALELRGVAKQLEELLFSLSSAKAVDSIRGFEGKAAERYFSVFSHLIKQNKDDFFFKNRTRRPPLDPVNAMLSFGYALLLNDCVSALTSVGLDPSVGFLHTDRPGRPALALDLMEELRALWIDRLVVKLINRREVSISGFTIREGGAVEMDDSTRKILIQSYQERKKEKLIHPLLNQEIAFGLLPFVQARLLARYLRGDLESYIPYLGT